MREHRWRRGRGRGRKGTRRGEETNEEEAHRRRSSSLENYPPRATLQVFAPPFSSEPQRARPELDAMVARGKCLNFSLSKISR